MAIAKLIPYCSCKSETYPTKSRYTPLMRILIVNLLAIAMLVMLLHGSFLVALCNCANIGDVVYTQPKSLTDSCCSQTSDESSDDSDQRPLPCDEDDCPAMCCTGTIQPVFAPLHLPKWPNVQPVIRVELPRFESELPQPHLLRLKRPPRTV